MADARPTAPRWVAFAVWAQGTGLSGGDNILVNLVDYWIKLFGISCTIVTSESGAFIYKRAGLTDGGRLSYLVAGTTAQERLSQILLYLVRTFIAVRVALTGDFSSYTHVYSSSDFWPDALAGYILKRRYPRITWVASLYLFAPNPFYGFHEGSRRLKRPLLKDVFYFLTQRPIYWLLKRAADRICVTSEPDVARFRGARCGEENVVVVRGGVDLRAFKDYFLGERYRSEPKEFDACFIGRFHRQKGVVELMDIWAEVLAAKPDAKLALIGDGPLREAVEAKIREHGMAHAVTLCGTLFGDAKNAVFKRSRLVLHPAVYDSGGMAAAEAMAFGLPAVGFDLEAFKTYYPRGMLKVPRGRLRDFAATTLDLLGNVELYERMSRESVDLVRTFWDFEARARELYPRMST